MIEGASWSSSNGIELNDGTSTPVGPSQIRWTQIDDKDRKERTGVTLPVYLNADRSDVLFTVELPFAGHQKQSAAMQAVCLTTNSSIL